MTRPVRLWLLLLIAALWLYGAYLTRSTDSDTGVPTSSAVLHGEEETAEQTWRGLGSAPEAGVDAPAPRASRSRRLPPPGPATLLDWHALALCESSGNPHAVSPSGRYRGLYQMDADFWRTYGGLRYAPRPDLASRAEQTAVARNGYAARGRQPWPTCGSRL